MTGRPAWIPTNSICEQAREMASRGLTVSQISDCLGISESTLYGKQNEYKAVSYTHLTLPTIYSV